MTQFNKMKMRINNPDHSKAVQEWLFEQGYGWTAYGSEKHSVRYTTESYLFTGSYLDDSITMSSDYMNYQDSPSEEINVQHLDPHLRSTRTYVQSILDNMLTNLKHVQKAIDKADNKQQKRLQDRDRMISKINEMLPEGVQCVVKAVENSSPFDPKEIVVGSVWECRSEGTIDTTLGYHYKVKNIENDGSVEIRDDVSCNTFNRHSFLKYFKRIS